MCAGLAPVRGRTMSTETKQKLMDPVCKCEVSADSKYKTFYKNGYYYFCSLEDLEEFNKEPEKYVKEPTTVNSCD